MIKHFQIFWMLFKCLIIDFYVSQQFDLQSNDIMKLVSSIQTVIEILWWCFDWLGSVLVNTNGLIESIGDHFHANSYEISEISSRNNKATTYLWILFDENQQQKRNKKETRLTSYQCETAFSIQIMNMFYVWWFDGVKYNIDKRNSSEHFKNVKIRNHRLPI